MKRVKYVSIAKFNKNVLRLVEIILREKDDSDVIDAAIDIDRIRYAENQIYNQASHAVEDAHLLNDELEEKYPVIIGLFSYLSALNELHPRNPVRIVTSSERAKTPEDKALDMLMQDRAGIICSVALKEEVITEYSQFVERLE